MQALASQPAQHRDTIICPCGLVRRQP
jgi:hypothetical protein